MSFSFDFTEDACPDHQFAKLEDDGDGRMLVREIVLWLVVVYDVMRDAQKVRDNIDAELKKMNGHIGGFADQSLMFRVSRKTRLYERELRWYIKSPDFEHVCMMANIDHHWAQEKTQNILDGKARIESKQAIKYQTRKSRNDDFIL